MGEGDEKEEQGMQGKGYIFAYAVWAITIVVLTWSLESDLNTLRWDAEDIDL